MTTHPEGRDAFIYMFDNVFEIGVEYPLALALEKCGYHDIHDIIGMSWTNVKALSYEDDQGNEIDLPILHRLPIIFLQTRFNFNNWKSITTQDFIHFAELYGFNDDDFSWKSTGESLSTMLSVAPKSTLLAIALKPIVHTTHAGRDALKHVLEVVLETEAHEPLAQALLYQGVFDIHAILRMSSDDVKGLNYKDCQGNETHLGLGTRNEIHAIQQYHSYHLQKGFPIGDNWKSITAQEFNAFRDDLVL
jgi:hypothetical protein